MRRRRSGTLPPSVTRADPYSFWGPPPGVGVKRLEPFKTLDPRRAWLRDSAIVLRDVDDRRRFHPAGPFLRPAVSIRNRSDTRMSVKRGLRRMAWHAVGFAVPDFVITCIRRKQRKEVLHAINFGGGGGGSVRPYRRRNALSNIYC